MTTKYYKCKLDKCLQCPVLKWSTRTLQQDCNKFWQIAKQPLICGGRVYWCKWCPRDYSRPKYWLRARDIRLAALEPSTAHLFLPQPPASPRHSSWQHLAVVNNKSPLHKNCHEERAADHLALWDLAQWWLEHCLGPYHDTQHAIHWSHPWRMYRSAQCQVCPIRMVDCIHVLRAYRLCHCFDHMSNHTGSSNDALECWTSEWSQISGSRWNFPAGYSLQALIKEQSRWHKWAENPPDTPLYGLCPHCINSTCLWNGLNKLQGIHMPRIKAFFVLMRWPVMALELPCHKAHLCQIQGQNACPIIYAFNFHQYSIYCQRKTLHIQWVHLNLNMFSTYFACFCFGPPKLLIHKLHLSNSFHSHI